MSAHSHQPLYLKTFIALMVLLTLTIGAAFLPLGHASLAVAMTIACVKAFLILFLFMHLREETGLIRLAGLIGFAWLLILFGITFSDYLTRKDVAPGPVATRSAAE